MSRAGAADLGEPTGAAVPDVQVIRIMETAADEFVGAPARIPYGNSSCGIGASYVGEGAGPKCADFFNISTREKAGNQGVGAAACGFSPNPQAAWCEGAANVGEATSAFITDVGEGGR